MNASAIVDGLGRREYRETTSPAHDAIWHRFWPSIGEGAYGQWPKLEFLPMQEWIAMNEWEDVFSRKEPEPYLSKRTASEL